MGDDESFFDELSSRRFTRRDVLKGAAAAGAAVSLGPLVAACGSSTASTAPSASAAAKPKMGGTVISGITGGSSSNTLKSHAEVTESDAARCCMCYEALTEIKADGTIAMLLAESMTPNKDATVWIIKCRPGVTWHNGKDFGADDVMYTYNYIEKNQQNGAGFLSLVDLPAMKVMDKLTLKVPMKVPYSTFIQVQPTWFLPIIPVDWDYLKPNGTGPFKITSFSPQQTVYVRNPNYWQSPKPYLDKVVMIEYEDETAMVNALLGGTVDTITLLSSDEISSLQSQGKKIVISPRWRHEPVHHEHPGGATLTMSASARRCVCWSTASRCWTSCSGATAPSATTSRRAGIRPTTRRFRSVSRTSSRPSRCSRPLARRTSVVQLNAADIAMGVVDTASVFAQQAKAAGVTVNLRKTTVTDFYGPEFLKYPFAFDYWGFQYYLPQVASDLLPNSPYPESHWDNPQTNKLYKQALATVDDAKRTEIAHEMQQIDHDQGDLIIPYFPPVIDSFNPNLQGVIPSKIGASWNNFDFMSYWLS